MRIWVKRGLLLCSLAALCAMLSLATLAVGYIGEDRAVGAVLRHTGGGDRIWRICLWCCTTTAGSRRSMRCATGRAAIRCTTPWTPKQGKSSTMGATGWATASPCRRTAGAGRVGVELGGQNTSQPALPPAPLKKKGGGSHRSQAKSSSKTAHLNLDKQNCQCYNEANSK